MSELPHSDDELLSAHLDGALDADEHALLTARLADEPALRARLDALDAARDLTATAPTPLPDEAADSLIAAALAARTAPVVDLSAARARRRFLSPPAAAAAAAVAVIALAIPALLSIDRNADDMDATTADTDATDDSSDDTAEAPLSLDMTEAGDAAAAEIAPESFQADDMAADEDSAADDEMAGDDSAASEGDSDDSGDDDSADHDDGAASESGERVPFRAAALFSIDPEFDPLGDALGDFDDKDALTDSVNTDWASYRTGLPPVPATTTNTSADVSDPTIDRTPVLEAGRERFDALVSPACDLADRLLDRYAYDPVVAADFVTATIDGSEVVVGILRRIDDSAMLVIIDPTTCEPMESLLS